jgi:hypothetical protein
LEEQRVLAWKKEGKANGWMSKWLIDRTPAAVCTWQRQKSDIPIPD